MARSGAKSTWLRARSVWPKSAAVRYVGGVLLLLTLGIAGELVASLLLEPGSASQELVRGLSEAALVSALLAALVDPYLKRRLQDDSGWGAVFGYLNPKAPPELREALRELADCRRYYTESAWTAHFAWHNNEKTILIVTLECTNTGINLDSKPYKPNGRPWVLASCDGCRTEYLRYTLSCPGHFPPLDAKDVSLTPYVVRQEDGSIYVEEGRLVGHRAIPPGVSFETLKAARMYRHANGYVPIHHAKFVDRLPFTLTGPALKDLELTVAHPRQEGRRFPEEWKRLATAVANPETRSLGRVTPGQVTLLSWSPAKL